MPQYLVRRVNLGKTAQLDALAHAAGQVYTRTLVFFWRTVRHKGIWLAPKHLMRLIPSDPDHRLACSQRRCGGASLLRRSQKLAQTTQNRRIREATEEA